jgi:hypothetical protein
MSYDAWRTATPDYYDEPTTAEAVCDSCHESFDFVPELDADEDGLHALPAPDLCQDCEGLVIKACGCGRRYTAVQWSRLEFGFYMHDEVDGLCEFRTCPCRSTLGIVVG